MKNSMQRRVLGILIAGFVVIFVINGFYSLKLLNSIRQNYRTSETSARALLAATINLKNEALKKFVEDYTVWDEMIKYIHSPDEVFARDNFILSSEIFKADYCLVFNENGNSVFAYNSLSSDHLNLKDYFDDMPSLFSKKPLIRFYLYHHGYVVEFFGGSIHPSLDTLRKSPPYGYFFVGKKWDYEFIEELKEITGLSFIPVTDTLKFDKRAQKIAFFLPLKGDIDTTPVVWLSASKTDSILNKLERSYLTQLTVVLLLCFIFLLLVIFLSLRWFVKPMRILKEALQNETDVTDNQRIMNVAEYNQIATLITTKAEQKKELNLTNKLYFNLLSLFPAPVVVTGKDFRIKLCNEKTIQLFKKTSDELTNEYFKDIFPEEVRETINHELKWLKFEKKGRNFEIQWVEQNGSKVYFEISSAVLKNEQGDIEEVIFSLFNQTALKLQYEALNEALKKAEESDQLKTSFLMSMSHELRTPLNVIIGLSSVCNKETSTEEMLEYAEIIKNSGLQLSGIIDDLFDVSLIESGNLRIENRKINIRDIFSDIGGIIRAEMQLMKKEHIRLSIPETAEDVEIFSDPIRVKQVLINLLKNALKFTEEGSVEAGYYLQNEKECVFYIKDSGIGIEKESQDKIFQKFWQAQETAGKSNRGAGLGLYISYHLAKLLNGNLWIESEKGIGSTFYFSVPLYKINNDKKLMTDLSESTNGLKGKKILLAEDEDFNFMLVRHLLKKHECEVVRATNGKEALDIFNKDSGFDAIIMDLRMPVMGGYEAIKEIRKTNTSIPIIALTAMVISGSREEVLDCGADEFIEKPFNPEILVERLKELIK
ncbi:MAG: response regulator [Sphingobacteriales bacterium]|nr:response regulator [Sphingobacteriales bacterium]